MRVLTLLFIANVAAGPLVFRNTGPQVAYVGSKACAGCHSGIYQKYAHGDRAFDQTCWHSLDDQLD